MRFIGMIALVASLAVAAGGCGSSSKSPTAPGNNETCGITLAGALSGQYTCTSFSGAWKSSDNTGGVGVTITGTPAITVAIGWTGEPHTGTYKDTDADAKSGITVTGANFATWAELVGGNTPAQGNYTLVISDVGTVVNTQDGKGYANMHGTLVATLPAVQGTPATGTVTLDASF